jgi:hypothetical protein
MSFILTIFEKLVAQPDQTDDRDKQETSDTQNGNNVNFVLDADIIQQDVLLLTISDDLL